MKRLVFTIFVFFACFAGNSYAQDADCPEGKVCLTRDAAIKALADADKVKAYEAEIVVKDQAIEDMRKLLNEMRIEFARVSGENTALKQNAVSDRAIIDILIKNAKRRCILSFCIGS